VQSALTLSSREFSELRFQVPACQGWLTARGRVAWLSDSKKEAGIQFTELPGEARREIHKWVSAEGDPKEARERIPAAFKGSPGSSEQIFDTPYRGGGGRTIPRSRRAQKETGRKRKKSTNERSPLQWRLLRPPPRDFEFGEYSMFARQPSEKETVWTEPNTTTRELGRRSVTGDLGSGTVLCARRYRRPGNRRQVDFLSCRLDAEPAHDDASTGYAAGTARAGGRAWAS